MIEATIKKCDQYFSYDSEKISFSDSEYKCINSISFDSENLIIKSLYSNGNDEDKVCCILFDLTDSFIKELKTLIYVIETEKENYD